MLIKVFDQKGTLLNSKSVFIDEFGTYVDPDIRNSVSGTFGEIISKPGIPPSFSLAARSSKVQMAQVLSSPQSPYRRKP